MRRRLALIALLAFGITALLVVGAPPPTYAQLDVLIARVKPAVVFVNTQGIVRGTGGSGSGFIFDPSGWILTNQHVIEGAENVIVQLPDRRTYPATVVDYMKVIKGSEETDVAVLKIDATSLPTVPLGTSAALRQGQDLLVLGYPGIPGVATNEQISVTRGIVSAVRQGWIQTDATINHGNSGGPVIDSQGYVVGLATFIVGGVRNVNGVVPIDAARDMARAAKIPGGRRYHRVDIPGREYISPDNLPKRKVFIRRYSPGKAQQQPSETQIVADITELREAYGAFLFTIKEGDTEATYHVSSNGGLPQGLIQLARSGPQTKYRFSEPMMIFPSPLREQWDLEYTVQDENALRMFKGSAQIETIDAVVTVPAGSYSHVVKIVIEEQMLVRAQQPQPAQQPPYHLTITKWYAPRVGLVRATEVVRETQEEVDLQLASATR